MIPVILAFMVCGVLNWGYSYTLSFLLLFMFFPLIKRQRIKMNFLLRPTFWILLTFGFAYILFGGISVDSVQNALILPMIAYIIGWCSFDQSDRNDNKAKKSFLGIATGFALHSGLNLWANIGNTNRGLLVDFWNGSYWSATGSGFLNTIIFSLFFYFTVIEKEHRTKRFFMILMIICGLYALLLGNRTQIVILVAVTAVAGSIYLFECGWQKNFSKTLVRVCFVVVLLFVLYRFNMFGMADLINKSNLVARFIENNEIQKSNTERVNQFLKGINNLFQHPFGGQKVQGYYHNMWLDISRIAGIVPMIIMLIYNGITCRDVVYMFRDKQIDIEIRYMMLSLYIGCLMNFFVEPVLEGLTSFFLAFCVMNGITENMFFTKKRTLGELQGEKREVPPTRSE